MERSLSDEHRAMCEGATWSLKFHLNRGDGGVLVHDCEALGLIRRIWTPKKDGRWGREEVSYQLIGEESGEEYSSLADALDAVIARRKGTGDE